MEKRGYISNSQDGGRPFCDVCGLWMSKGGTVRKQSEGRVAHHLG